MTIPLAPAMAQREESPADASSQRCRLLPHPPQRPRSAEPDRTQRSPHLVPTPPRDSPGRRTGAEARRPNQPHSQSPRPGVVVKGHDGTRKYRFFLRGGPSGQRRSGGVSPTSRCSGMSPDSETTSSAANRGSRDDAYHSSETPSSGCHRGSRDDISETPTSGDHSEQSTDCREPCCYARRESDSGTEDGFGEYTSAKAVHITPEAVGHQQLQQSQAASSQATTAVTLFEPLAESIAPDDPDRRKSVLNASKSATLGWSLFSGLWQSSHLKDDASGFRLAELTSHLPVGSPLRLFAPPSVARCPLRLQMRPEPLLSARQVEQRRAAGELPPRVCQAGGNAQLRNMLAWYAKAGGQHASRDLHAVPRRPEGDCRSGT
eukprot:TRINITY_DN14418_c0_g1_i2.p1 TRINITY_DN14418_c0_g1~~TRINITY_DN14418_c0_g1_i2.p1  ORF type:complete len:376 (+),score=19.95 TRINITY_DN14418_c0_g1_i2:107-1234(+)